MLVTHDVACYAIADNSVTRGEKELFMVFLLYIIETDEDLALVNELFVNHHKELFNIAMSMLRNKQNAEDALQEGFVKIINNLQNIQKIPCPERIRFCVVILKNVSVDILRKQKRSIHSDNLYDISDKSELDIEDEYIRKEDVETLLRVFDKLNRVDRQLILLRYCDDLPFKQIGNILEISEEVAKKRAQRLLTKLRKGIDLSNME